MLGASDNRIVDLARHEERTLMTYDKHFADLVLYQPDTHWAVIRIRFHPPLLPVVIEALDLFLKQFDLSTIRVTLIVLERNRLRIRRAALT